MLVSIKRLLQVLVLTSACFSLPAKATTDTLNIGIGAEFENLNPTAENIVVVIWNKIRKKIDLQFDLEVILYETPRNFVTYKGE